jgi:hypothetical protein
MQTCGRTPGPPRDIIAWGERLQRHIDGEQHRMNLN